MQQTAHNHLGPHHPDTLLARGNLATSYADAGRTTEAIALLEQVLADRERVLGAEHPGTEATRAALARWLGGEGDAGAVGTD
ncbi:tetratricopeptide repeat protein [Streptomyces sodiiphilus]|uniref:tetratricopeptide repeat protein n=1 Tax=Streptomyces sodiiphilus TaxID=226217 RepID=UPI003CD0B3B5